MLAKLYSLMGQLGDANSLGIPNNSANTSSIQPIMNVVYMLAGAIAVIVIIIAGINYASSGGDAGKMAKAKSTILYAIVGLIVVGTAFMITAYVARIAET